MITPDRYSARSGNTCFLAEKAKEVELYLARNKVLVWGEYGRVRVSGHLYNSSQDLERLLAVLKRMP